VRANRTVRPTRMRAARGSRRWNLPFLNPATAMSDPSAFQMTSGEVPPPATGRDCRNRRRVCMDNQSRVPISLPIRSLISDVNREIAGCNYQVKSGDRYLRQHRCSNYRPGSFIAYEMPWFAPRRGPGRSSCCESVSIQPSVNRRTSARLLHLPRRNYRKRAAPHWQFYLSV